MLKFLSVNSIVIPPASTGSDNNNNIAVINTDHANNGNLWKLIPGARIFIIVVKKFIAPKRDDTPARWSDNIPKSTDPPEWAWIEDNGGYNVHPVPAPLSTIDDNNNNINEGGNSQNDILFNLGNAMSTAPNNTGTM